jgi:DNA-binding LacI/PurR family transcriptional regulator
MAENKRPSIREVARMAEVSVATVSNVLGGRKPVNAALTARVLAAVKTLGYRTDRAASQLRSGKARVIAVLVPSLDNPFFTSIIAALEQAAQTDGYDIIIASSNNDPTTEARRLSALLSWRPAGVVILPADDAFGCHALLVESATPFVVVDRLSPHVKADSVTIDNQQAAAMACDHLAALGHQDILVVASSTMLSNIRARIQGIKRRCRKLGLVAPKVVEAGMSLESASGRLAAWFGVNQRPTGIIALTNFTTIGVIASLGQHGLHAPDDVSLVGFDDYAWMQAVTPTITAVRQPVERLGEQAWTCLRERIEGHRSAPRTVVLECSLQVRGSSASVRTQQRRAMKTAAPERHEKAAFSEDNAFST